VTDLLVWLFAAALVAASERRPQRPLFLLAAFAFLTMLGLLVIGDIQRATVLALVLALAIAGASAVKYHHSGMKLAVADLALTFAGTVPFMIRQYRRTAIGTLIGALFLLVVAVLGLVFLRGEVLTWPQRLLSLAASLLALIAIFRRYGGAPSFRPDVTKGARFFSFFMASLVDLASWWPSSGLRMLDVGKAPLPLQPPRPGRTGVTPDIIVVQHESVFDPRIFGLPVDDKLAAFFKPPGAHAGTLHVDIYGGGSWQTEFSLLTGLSSASFGPDAYFLFRKGVGRFGHSLPIELGTLGYRSMLVTSCRQNFLNYDAFYAGIGAGERLFIENFPRPFDIGAFEITNSDAMFFEAARGALTRSLERDPSPRFVMALTNFNHGPHETEVIPAGEREAARSAALQAFDDPTYAEYCARLDETVDSWNAFKAALAAEYPGRPMLFVRYGDHQPTMTRAIEKAQQIRSDDPRLFDTFFAIEAVGFEPDFSGLPARLDIAMLGTAALHAAGLPLSAVSATRLSLLAECGDAYMASASERKFAFHRTLVDHGLIRLGRAKGALRQAAKRA